MTTWQVCLPDSSSWPTGVGVHEEAPRRRPIQRTRAAGRMPAYLHLNETLVETPDGPPAPARRRQSGFRSPNRVSMPHASQIRRQRGVARHLAAIPAEVCQITLESYFQVFHGATDFSHMDSNSILSRSVSMGSQNPLCL